MDIEIQQGINTNKENMKKVIREGVASTSQNKEAIKMAIKNANAMNKEFREFLKDSLPENLELVEDTALDIVKDIASEVWEETDVKVNASKEKLEIIVADWYIIRIEGQAVVYVELLGDTKVLDLSDLWFINLIDERASEIEDAANRGVA